jgi:iron complex outermembrane receptor protein
VSGVSEQQYREDKRWWSHELNFTSDNDSPLQWLAGVYYYKEFYFQPLFFPTEVGSRNYEVALNPVCTSFGCGVGAPAIANPSGIIYTTQINGEGESYAGFGQLDWEFADKWKLTGGLRYTHDKKTGVESTRQICYSVTSFWGCPDLRQAGDAATAGDATYALINNPLQPQPAGVTGPPTRDPVTGFWSRGYGSSWQATTGTLGLQWEPSPDTLIYAKYSRGYKAGGFNVGTISGGTIMTQPESVSAYEFGVKAQPFERLTTNVSAFYYDYQDRQTPIFVVPMTGPLRADFVNVPKSISQGVELETTWFATDNFRLLFNYAYLDAKVEEGCCWVDGVDPLAVAPGAQPAGAVSASGQEQTVAGQQLPNSPKHRVTVNGLYTIHLPGDSSLDLSASYIWRDKAYAQFFNRDHHTIPAWDQVDLRATWTDSSDRYKVILFGRNVLDEEGYDLSTATARGASIYQTISLTPPRTWGVELQAKF